MTENTAESPGERALLLAENLELGHDGRVLSWPDTVSVRAERLLCVGQAEALLTACVDPTLIRRGSLRLRGDAPRDLLLSGRAGYCPKDLPVPPEFRVFDALLGSARLIGLGARDVEQALRRAEADGLGRRRISELGRLERRLVGLAHGLTGSPELFLLEDPFTGLEDDAAELMLAVLERELEGRAWITGTDLASPWSRRWAQTAELALSADGEALLGPVAPQELVSPGSWARFDQVNGDLVDQLTGRGAEVITTPNQHVLVVRRLGGLAIADVASQTGASLLELVPLGR